MSETRERHCPCHGPFQSVNGSTCPTCNQFYAEREDLYRAPRPLPPKDRASYLKQVAEDAHLGAEGE